MRVASWFPLAVLVGWIGADMADGTTASSASAVLVAVVDIEKVIGGLEQRADAERKLQARAAKIQADGDAWKSRLSEAEQAMQTAEGSAAHSRDQGARAAERVAGTARAAGQDQ